ncbi:TlyA family rRNA (cytidine-2'-O)-methyltransferase [Paraliobacillus quinghaiensis]|uniref:TlyA family rRNA (Cytidine-2'-O)-methyltransferase n=1 Tax=Paraliobacillus quinghaiensis TaxID=470815 RepID=A0A917WY65_9BACI|nr:TlyA family RNA methyltransferase [Paraliobacillus quinghaiensis]GGM40313.1 TlyA family rRNA (cytidine-2'-O)-methyltransferase [Paraliobacillus quinghaiensis]
MTSKKTRLDILLVERGLVETREKAKRAIMAGIVFSEQQRMDKPGVKVNGDIPLSVKGKLFPYVGRGGLKLEKALKTFDFSVKDKIMLDIGSSTGGFTDCALQNGASLCYAVDVGYNQLDWKLRNDPRVIVMERTNFRYATIDMFDKGSPHVATIDVSFISLKLILPTLATILETGGEVVALIKPQFEAGKEQVGKKGIVRDKRIHQQVVEDILYFALNEGYRLKNLTFSPITGGDGNIEFLAHLTWKPSQDSGLKTDTDIQSLVTDIIKDAHEGLTQQS